MGNRAWAQSSSRGVSPDERCQTPSAWPYAVELTISVALGLLVVLATISLYRGQRFAYDQATETTRMRDAASTALDLIGQQVQMAGFVPPSADLADKSPALFGCSPGRPASRRAGVRDARKPFGRHSCPLRRR